MDISHNPKKQVSLGKTQINDVRRHLEQLIADINQHPTGSYTPDLIQKYAYQLELALQLFQQLAGENENL